MLNKFVKQCVYNTFHVTEKTTCVHILMNANEKNILS